MIRRNGANKISTGKEAYKKNQRESGSDVISLPEKEAWHPCAGEQIRQKAKMGGVVEMKRGVFVVEAWI